jgi:hypothetical protein
MHNLYKSALALRVRARAITRRTPRRPYTLPHQKSILPLLNQLQLIY